MPTTYSNDPTSSQKPERNVVEQDNFESVEETEGESAIEARRDEPKMQEEKKTTRPVLNLQKNKTPKHKALPQLRDELSVKIEKVLEEGLAEEYAKLSPVAKQEFKIKGEKTTAQIRDILQSTKIKAKEIFYILVEWLKTLPGVNRFFLEQEAKIKTDKIIELHKRQQEKNGLL